MKFSVNWLREWVEVDLDGATLAERLTAAGLEVDSVAPAGGGFEGVVVGEVTACEPHPDADALSVCRVRHGECEAVQVVCGAPNVRQGLKVPFAQIGAVLADGTRIGTATLRGVESQGMACSARELGLSDDHSGLMELPGEATVGADLREFLGLDDDEIIGLDLTPNRADCLGIRGLARDVAAICGAKYTPLEVDPVPPAIEDRIEIRLAAPEDCPRYVGRIVRGIDASAPSPLWMVERLRRSGIRSISAVVDLTNYVLMELGQPMHAFDLPALSGGIEVRRGREGERLTLLDGKQVEVDDRLLAICDDSGPVALAGIMGGRDTGVGQGTTDVLLESAWFRPATISGRARELGLHTDASHRFERGVDPDGQIRAIERLTGLLLEVAGGQAGPVLVAESKDHLPTNPEVVLRTERLRRVLGTGIEEREVDGILEALDMRTERTDQGWRVTAPPARFDISIEEDLIEEIARIHGYDALPATPPAGVLQPGVESETCIPLYRIREALCASGYFEAITYSFVDQRLLATLQMDDDVLALANPISSDMDVMRTSLLPGLLRAMERNRRRQQERVRLFEIGRAFLQGETLREIDRVAAVACGTAHPEQWGLEGRSVDFYDAKRDVEALLGLRGQDGSAHFEPADCPWLHPGQSARIRLDGQAVGWVGAVHPGVLKNLEIRDPVMAFELDLEGIRKREIPYTKEISPYPFVRRDLSFLVPEKVKYSEIKAVVEETAGAPLVNLIVFDQFSGQNVEKGYKSLSIGLILQDVSCTLTDEVVDSIMSRVVAGLESTLNAQLRG